MVSFRKVFSRMTSLVLISCWNLSNLFLQFLSYANFRVVDSVLQMIPQKEDCCRKIGRSWRSLDLIESWKDEIPDDDRSTDGEPALCRSENGSPDAELALAFDPTFQRAWECFFADLVGLSWNAAVTDATFSGVRPIYFGPSCFIGTTHPVSRHCFTQETNVFREEGRLLCSLPNLLRKLRFVCAADSVFA
jgi:hypothetical protein